LDINGVGNLFLLESSKVQSFIMNKGKYTPFKKGKYCVHWR